jgi:hypothetical protein
MVNTNQKPDNLQPQVLTNKELGLPLAEGPVPSLAEGISDSGEMSTTIAQDIIAIIKKIVNKITSPSLVGNKKLIRQDKDNTAENRQPEQNTAKEAGEQQNARSNTDLVSEQLKPELSLSKQIDTIITKLEQLQTTSSPQTTEPTQPDRNVTGPADTSKDNIEIPSSLSLMQLVAETRQLLEERTEPKLQVIATNDDNQNTQDPAQDTRQKRIADLLDQFDQMIEALKRGNTGLTDDLKSLIFELENLGILVGRFEAELEEAEEIERGQISELRQPPTFHVKDPEAIEPEHRLEDALLLGIESILDQLKLERHPTHCATHIDIAKYYIEILANNVDDELLEIDGLAERDRLDCREICDGIIKKLTTFLDTAKTNGQGRS